MLYFYPKDETHGCTVEACMFRDKYEAFKKYDAEVVGISSDSIDSHRNFASKHNLPFVLLSDKEEEVRKLYGVSSTWGVIPGRVTFIIDKKGIIRHIFSSQRNLRRHIDKALEALRAVEG